MVGVGCRSSWLGLLSRSQQAIVNDMRAQPAADLISLLWPRSGSLGWIDEFRYQVRYLILIHAEQQLDEGEH